MDGVFFFQIEDLLSLKNAWLNPQFSFWIPEALAKFCFPRIVLNRNICISRKTHMKTHRKPEYLEMRRTYAQ